MADREAAARLFRHARREAMVVLVVWALALAWSVGYCYLYGYEHSADSWVVQAGLAPPPDARTFRPVAGFPDWVVYGILLPWLACTAFTIYFALFGMTDDDLGAEAEEGADRGH
jgi:hypothetical protein